MPATSEIREHMEVLGSDGEHVGTVDHLDEQGRIKLTKSDSVDGKHHLLDADMVDHVDDHVHLNLTAEEAMDEWKDIELEEDEEGQSTASNEDQWMKERTNEIK